jgi:hypothetical protein
MDGTIVTVPIFPIARIQTRHQQLTRFLQYKPVLTTKQKPIISTGYGKQAISPNFLKLLKNTMLNPECG